MNFSGDFEYNTVVLANYPFIRQVILSPLDSVADTYRALLPEGTTSEFQRILELKVKLYFVSLYFRFLSFSFSEYFITILFVHGERGNWCLLGSFFAAIAHFPFSSIFSSYLLNFPFTQIFSLFHLGYLE